MLVQIIKSLFARPYETIDTGQAMRLLDEGGELIDVRTLAEWNQGHAAPARHVPLTDISGEGAHLSPGKHYIVMCSQGYRSARAAQLLAQKGLLVSNLRGGYDGWRRAGGKVVRG